jgi:NAD(P)-dependent dehydrogenase (short-subunit alcohol dehydrogenase family)
MDMTGKVVLVTGAAQGIGLGTARAFRDAGARVAMCDRNEDALRDGARSLAGESRQSEVAEIVADVSDGSAVRQMVAETVGCFGTVDVLVNNAGFGMMKYFWEIEDEEWNTILGTTLTGTFLCAREVARVMLERRIRGKIINIASTNALIPSTGIAPYCAAKGGVLMFTRVAALELAPHGITVNAIGPGTTLTPVTEAFYNLPGLREAFLDRTPMGRFGTVEDIARVALFLASEYADWVTGQLILADGGQSLLGLPRYLEGLDQATGGSTAIERGGA